MDRASGGSNTPHWIMNNIFDFLRAMSMKIAVENGKICRSMSTGCEREQFWLLFLKLILQSFLKIFYIIPSPRGVEKTFKVEGPGH